MTKKLPETCDHCGKPFQKKGTLNFCNYHVAYLVNPKNRDGKPVKKHWCSECSKKNSIKLPGMPGSVITATTIKNDKDEDIYELQVISHRVEDIPGYDFYRIDIIATHLPSGEWASFIRNFDIEEAVNYRWNIRMCIHASKIRGIICDILYWATSDPQRCFALLEEDRKKRKWKQRFVSKEPWLYQLCIEAETSEHERDTLFRTNLFRSEEACISWVIANRLLEVAEVIADKYPTVLEKPWREYAKDSDEVLELCKRAKEWLRGDEGGWFLGCDELRDGWDPLSWDMKSFFLVEK
jgi:hypothetical protein